MGQSNIPDLKSKFSQLPTEIKFTVTKSTGRIEDIIIDENLKGCEYVRVVSQ